MNLKIIVASVVREYINDKIDDSWSLKQIYFKSKIENLELDIPSFSTIYRWIHLELIAKGDMKKLRRKGKLVTPAIIEMMPSLPSYMIKTITYDRGKGFTGYEEIEKTLNCEVYFADSYCSWHRGTNENTNGLLREYYPKGMDFHL